MCARPEFQYSFTAAFMSYTFCIFIICNQDFKAAVKPLSSPLWCLSIHLRRHQSPFVINAAQWRQHTEVIHWRSSSWVISDFNKHLGETSYHTIFKAQQLSHLNNLFDSTACVGGGLFPHCFQVPRWISAAAWASVMNSRETTIHFEELKKTTKPSLTSWKAY